MRRITGFKKCGILFLTIFLIVGVAQLSFANDTITGVITKIDNTRVTLRSGTEEEIIIVNDPTIIKAGDYVKVIYHALADLLIAEDIQILPQP